MKLISQAILILVLVALTVPSTARAETIYIRNVAVELQANGQAKITWTTNIPATGMLLYSPDDSYRYAVGTSRNEINNEVVLVNLTPNITYNFKINATAGASLVTSFVHTFKTGTWKIIKALNISNIRSSYVGGTAINITWATDRESTSAIEAVTETDYLANGFSKGVKKASSRSKVINHQITLKGLKVNTIYYYRISSEDKDGNKAFSSEFRVTTQVSAVLDNANLEINKIAPASSPDPLITDTTVTFIWETNKPSLGHLTIKDETHRSKSNKVVEEGIPTYNHRLVITGLNPRTTYSYNIYGLDILGKKFTTEKRIVRTGVESVVAGASTSIYSYSNLTPPAVKSGYKYYTDVPRDIPLEQEVATKLRDYLHARFGRVPSIAPHNWFTLVRAFTYGGYPIESIGQAVKFGGKTVHPLFFWSVWNTTSDYKNYISA